MAYYQNIIKTLLLLTIALSIDATKYFSEEELLNYNCNGKPVLCVGPMEYKFCFRDADGDTFPGGEAIYCPANYRCVNDGVDVCVRLLATTKEPPVRMSPTQFYKSTTIRAPTQNKMETTSVRSKPKTLNKTNSQFPELPIPNVTETVIKSKTVEDDSSDQAPIENSSSSNFYTTSISTQPTPIVESKLIELLPTLSTKISTSTQAVKVTSAKPETSYVVATTLEHSTPQTPSIFENTTLKSSVSTTTQITMDNTTSTVSSTREYYRTENTKIDSATKSTFGTTYTSPTLSTLPTIKTEKTIVETTTQTNNKYHNLTKTSAFFNGTRTPDLNIASPVIVETSTVPKSSTSTYATSPTNATLVTAGNVMTEKSTHATIPQSTNSSFEGVVIEIHREPHSQELFTSSSTTNLPITNKIEFTSKRKQEESIRVVYNVSFENATLSPERLNSTFLNNTEHKDNFAYTPQLNTSNQTSSKDKSQESVDQNQHKDEHNKPHTKPITQTKHSLLSHWNIDWSLLQTSFVEPLRIEPAENEESAENEKPTDEEDLNKKDKKKKLSKKQKKSIKKFLKLIKADKCDEDDVYADYKDCKKYYRCIEKSDETKFEHLECDDDKFFDTKKEKCVKEEKAHCFTIEDLFEEFD